MDDPQDTQFFSKEGLKRLAEIIASARRGRSLNRFATETGISDMTLTRLERGEVAPRLHTLVRIAPYTNYKPSQLFEILVGQEDAEIRRIRLQEKINSLAFLSHDPDVAKVISKWEREFAELERQESQGLAYK